MNGRKLLEALREKANNKQLAWRYTTKSECDKTDYSYICKTKIGNKHVKLFTDAAGRKEDSGTVTWFYRAEIVIGRKECHLSDDDSKFFHDNAVEYVGDKQRKSAAREHRRCEQQKRENYKKDLDKLAREL